MSTPHKRRRLPETLTRDQKMALVVEAIKWVERVERIEAAVLKSQAAFLGSFVRYGLGMAEEFTGDPLLDDGFVNAHLLAIALRQIQEHLRMLKAVGFDPAIAGVGHHFLTVMERDQARFLRNLLEHRAEYLAGVGKFRERLKDTGPSFEFTAEEGHVLTITTFGIKFVVNDAVEAAKGLQPSLEAYRAGLSSA